MYYHYWISKSWMLSRAARRVYRTSAWLSIALFITLLGWGFWVEFVPEFLVRSLLFLGILGAAITIVSMEYFLFGFDTSSDMKKVFSFVLMLIPLLGAAIYCLRVYSRAPEFHAPQPEKAHVVSSSF